MERNSRYRPRIQKAMALSSHVARHLVVPFTAVGALIGQAGTRYQALVQRCGCDVLILNREGVPPGSGQGFRAVLLIGTSECVQQAADEIGRFVQLGHGQLECDGQQLVADGLQALALQDREAPHLAAAAAAAK